MAQPLLPIYSMNSSGSPLTGDGSSDAILWPGGKGVVYVEGTFDSATLQLETQPVGATDQWSDMVDGEFTELGHRTLDLPGECEMRFTLSGSATESLEAKIYTGTPSSFTAAFPAVSLVAETSRLVGSIHADSVTAALSAIRVWTGGGVPTAPTCLLELIDNDSVNPDGTMTDIIPVNPKDSTSADVEIRQGSNETQIDAHDSTAARDSEPFHLQVGVRWEKFFNRVRVIEVGNALAVWVTSPENVDECKVFVEVEQYLS
ncbi:MAG: hypothetical protein WDZ59_12580 [Pirellulales bacterium]